MPRRSDIELSAEERLRLNEKRMRLAQAVAHVGSWEIDLLTGEMWGSEEAFRLYGFPLEPSNRLSLKQVQAIPVPEHRPALDRALRELMEGAAYDVEFDILRADDGTRRTIHSLAELVRDEQGRAIAVNGTLQDITEERRITLALKASEERARMVIDQAADAIVSISPERRLLDVNERSLELTGYSRTELLSLPLERLFKEGELARVPLRFSRLDQGEIVVTERVIVRRDGVAVPVEMRSRQLPDGTYQTILRDLTERKRAEEERAQLEQQLHRAQKMEAIGLLAGGVAHDFNNLLTAIGGNASLGLADPELTPSMQTRLGEISAAVASGANLTRQLLAFSRKQVIAPRVLDLNEAVHQASRLLRRLLGEGIEVTTRLTGGLGMTRLDPGQVEQVLVNLAINARDAMDGRGKLTLETFNVRLDEAYCRTRSQVTPGEHVLLAVSDDGCGMSPETRARIFEPFFTTKEQGKGTGLGLAMVYGAVRQSGGHIEVYSEPGRGSTFKLYFPRVDPASEDRRAVATAPVPRGTETIVLVEDEPSVRNAAELMLRWLGYPTHSFESGAAALAAMPTLKEAPRLLITDVVMPGMNGRELAERMCAQIPGLRVLYASGYTHNVIASHGALEPGLEFLGKPYTLDSLARRIREVLDGGKGAGRVPGS